MLELKKDLLKSLIGSTITIGGAAVTIAAKTNKQKKIGVAVSLCGHAINCWFHYRGLAKETDRLSREACDNLKKYQLLLNQMMEAAAGSQEGE